jgi:pyruvate-ferredoxin/flavodoxin oxidoreductase
MARLAARTGRPYRLFDYVGHPEAERVLVLMGSGVGAAEEAVERLCENGERVGLVKVRLFRPFDAAAFVATLPATVGHIAVLDRTKDPAAQGEPLFQDVITALAERSGELPRVIGGRYGLSSKEFTPAMAAAALGELKDSNPKRRFTVGITDDVTHLSLDVDRSFTTEREDVVKAVFYGLGADGTVGANRNSIRIIADAAGLYGQGYFVLDSKKAGSMTVSHLRFGPRPINSTYLVQEADFVACHQFGFLDRIDVLDRAAEGGTFLLNSPFGAAEVWEHLPAEVKLVFEYEKKKVKKTKIK